MSLRAALSSPDGKRRYVRRLFATIADRYDFITRALSYGQDARWKRRLIALAAFTPDDRVLDVACGTGDLLYGAAPQAGRVVGLDLTHRMLVLARARAQSGRRAQKRFHAGTAEEQRKSEFSAPSRSLREIVPAISASSRPAFSLSASSASASSAFPVALVTGDMLALPFRPSRFTVVTTGYGLRNVPDLDGAIAEVRRVLVPGGRFLSLDFNRPENRVVRAAYLAYLTVVGSVLGYVLHRDPDTYRYIPESIRRYPGAQGVAQLLGQHGFTEVQVIPVLGGLMAIHTARTPSG